MPPNLNPKPRFETPELGTSKVHEVRLALRRTSEKRRIIFLKNFVA